MADEEALKRLLVTTAARGAGAARAFEQLYRSTGPMLLGSALRIVRRRELAEEVLHDSFIRIWRNAERFDPAGTALGWMAAIVRNRALDMIASHDVSRVDSYHALDGEAIEGDPEASLDRLFDWTQAEPADERLDRTRAASMLRACIGELDAPERQSLVLAYLHGLSHADLAAHLQRPLGTVKTWVRRAMDQVRRCVDRCAGDARRPAGTGEGDGA